MTLLLNLALAIALFLIINWLGRNATDFGYKSVGIFEDTNDSIALNFIIKSLSPTVFITFASGILINNNAGHLTNGIYLTTLIYFFMRLIAIFMLSQQSLISWNKFFFYSGFGIASTMWAYQELIVPQKPLIPNFEMASGEIWLGIAAFIYAAANKVQLSTGPTTARRNKYILNRYNEIKKLYGDIIESLPDLALELMTYSIIIYENYNRPKFVRKIESLIHPYSKTVGIMQVGYHSRISDRKSVEIGVRMIHDFYIEEVEKGHSSKFDIIFAVVSRYNKDDGYIYEVGDIMRNIAARVDSRFGKEYEKLSDQFNSEPSKSTE